MSIQEGESLESWGPRPVYTESMRSNGQTGRADGHALGGGKDLECRRCRVLCERVVHPVECVRHGCSYTYAFTQEDITFFGCLEKVFAPELNLQPHIESPRRDPYGALKVQRDPRDECVVSTKAYGFLYSWRECRNHTFGQEPQEYSAEAVSYTHLRAHETKAHLVCRLLL